MEFIQNLFSTYPSGELTPQDFIDRLAIGADGWQNAWLSIALTVIFGLLVYIIPIYLTEKDHEGPYPLWMHTFYFAADFMGIWVFLEAWKNYEHYPLFLILAIGEAIWVLMETYSLQRALSYEKEIIWKAGTPTSKALMDIIIQIIIFFASLNLLRVELHDSSMWLFWIFTQVIITTAPGLALEKKATRKGHNLALHIVLICVSIVTFNPWINMWMAIAPDIFSPSVNPWYYLTGLVCFILSVRGLIIYLRLPKKNK